MSEVVSKTIDYSLIGIGTLVGIAEIESVLGVIILIIQGVWILAKFVMSIYDAIKNKDSSKVLSTIKELQSDVKEVKESLETDTTKKEGD